MTPKKERNSTQTLHGTAIYMPTLTPQTTPGLIGSPMAVPWSVWERNSNYPYVLRLQVLKLRITPLAWSVDQHGRGAESEDTN